MNEYTVLPVNSLVVNARGRAAGEETALLLCWGSGRRLGRLGGAGSSALEAGSGAADGSSGASDGTGGSTGSRVDGTSGSAGGSVDTAGRGASGRVDASLGVVDEAAGGGGASSSGTSSGGASGSGASSGGTSGSGASGGVNGTLGGVLVVVGSGGGSGGTRGDTGSTGTTSNGGVAASVVLRLGRLLVLGVGGLVGVGRDLLLLLLSCGAASGTCFIREETTRQYTSRLDETKQLTLQRSLSHGQADAVAGQATARLYRLPRGGGYSNQLSTCITGHAPLGSRVE